MSDENKTPEQLAAEQAAAEEKNNQPIQSDAVNDFVESYLADPPAKKKEAAKGKAKASDDEPDPDAAGKKKAPPKRKQAPPPPPPAEIDYEKLADAVGEGAARAMAKEAEKEKNKAAKEPPADETLVSPKKLKVLERMGERDPKYKGLSERYVAQMKKLKAYADQWEKDNPGEKFNEDDDEHAETIAELEEAIDYDEDTYAEAVADLRYEEREAERREKEKTTQREDPELEEIKLQHKRQKRAGEMIKERDDVGNLFWEHMGEEFKGVVKEDGSLDMELLKEIEETAPEKYQEAVAAFQAIEGLAQEAFMLGEGLVQYDGNNRGHVFLDRFAGEREQAMMELSREDRMNEKGQEFLPIAEYVKLSDAKKKQHWTFSYGDLNRLLAARLAKVAKDQISAEEKKFERIAKARGLPVENKGKPNARPGVGAARERAADLDDDGDEKPKTPSLQPESRMASTKKRGAAPPKTTLEAWANSAID